MTKREREQVVELLRCCADECLSGKKPTPGLYVTAQDLGHRTWEMGRMKSRVWSLARDARLAVDILWAPYEVTCLEAAARVEEGEYP